MAIATSPTRPTVVDNWPIEKPDFVEANVYHAAGRVGLALFAIATCEPAHPRPYEWVGVTKTPTH